MTGDAPESGPPRAADLIGLDHAVLGVRDLVAAGAAYARLGFTLTPVGRHVGRGTANLCAMFGEDYLELRAVTDPAQAAEGLAGFLERGEGLYGVVLGAASLDRAAAALAAAGVAFEGPRALRRVIAAEGETITLDFRALRLAPAATPGLAVTVMEHLSLAALRRPEWLSHPNGARAIAEAALVVADPAAAAEAWRLVFGPAAVVEARGAFAVAVGRARLVLLSAAAFAERFDGEAAPGPARALTLAVRDPAATALYLSGQRVAFTETAAGTILVPPAEACGVLLAFGRVG